MVRTDFISELIKLLLDFLPKPHSLPIIPTIPLTSHSRDENFKFVECIIIFLNKKKTFSINQFLWTHQSVRVFDELVFLDAVLLGFAEQILEEVLELGRTNALHVVHAENVQVVHDSAKENNNIKTMR